MYNNNITFSEILQILQIPPKVLYTMFSLRGEGVEFLDEFTIAQTSHPNELHLYEDCNSIAFLRQKDFVIFDYVRFACMVKRATMKKQQEKEE